MAKKTYRGRRPLPRTEVKAQPTGPTVAPAIRTQARSAQPQTSTPKGAPDFQKEYHYVFSDLRRVGTLAAVLLVALIILSFVLR